MVPATALGVGVTLLLQGPAPDPTSPISLTAAVGAAAPGTTQAATSIGAAASAGARVVAVGDIASASGLDDAVADRVAQLDPDALLLIGDIAYPDGAPRDFSAYFDPDWSRFTDIWMPVPGNHEFRIPWAAGYREYFGIPSGPLYSSRRIGTWLVVGLNSERARSAKQLGWLRDTLAAHDGTPTLVMWHRARYSSGQHGDEPGTDALWDVVKVDPDVRLVLWGHDHDYERMSVPVAGHRLPAMVVGTGGGTLRDTPPLVTRSWRDRFIDHTTGVLDLRLDPGSFSWAFVTADGATLDDGTWELVTPRAQVLVKSVDDGSKLRVNVNPNQGSRNWRFDVQRRRADATWVTRSTHRTRGAAETRTLDLPAGTYRVRVHPKFGYRGARSRAVVLQR